MKPKAINCKVCVIMLAILFCFWGKSSFAQLFSIDINGTVRGDVTAPGFTPWYMAPDITGGSTATRSFTNFVYTFDPDTGLPNGTNVGSIITCTVAMTVPASSDSTHYLNANYANKNGNSTSPDPNSGYRLSEDGCWSHWKDDSITVDQPNTNGGAISLTISGLSAGVHSITTYHNDLWGSSPAWHSNNVMSKCIISVNGTPAYTNTPSVVATNDSQCGFAFFYITNGYDGQPVVLNFDPDHSSVLDFTILNGFEIDRPSPPGTTASAINPTPNFEHAFANNDVPLPGTANAGWLVLQWQPAGFAISNYLYFGVNSQAVATATTASNCFLGASVAVPGVTNSFNVTNLNSLLTYYWRVDQLDVDGGVTNLVTGPVWEFRTRHLAFPTAEGYGRWSRGGRGGLVMEVTNLNDSGPGSYRAAIGASGPRTIVFKVSGVIYLQSQCVIGNGYVTIAGQTSPDGICLANWRAGCNGPNDVIMRYLEFRVGDHAEQAMDAMSPSSAHDSIFDHLTSSWSLDVACNSLQTSKVGSGQCNCSYQHNIISECLNYSYHYNDAERAATGCTNCYQPHAFAASIGGEIGSYHHNLIANSTDRNWSLAGSLDQSGHLAGSLDIRNNVVYNWTSRTTDGGADRVDYENNYYKSYSSNPSAKYLLKTDANDPTVGWGNAGYYYMAGNVMKGVSGQADLYTNNWANGGYENGASMQAILQTNAELYPSYVTTQTATNAYEVVLSDVGCNLPQKDLIDQRVVGEVMSGTVHYEGTNGPNYTINGVLQDDRGPDSPGMIDSQTDVHDYQNTNSSLPNYSANWPWPPFNTAYNTNDYLDTDHDGLPDWWERIKGLNTNSAPGDFSDANVDLVGDGYTELDRYLNWMALPHYDCTSSTTLNVDLTQYTCGFTNLNPVYAVFNAAGGTVTLNGSTAQFTPNTGVEALGSFMYAVTDNTGFSYTNTINIHILSDGSVQNVPSAPTNVMAVAGNTQVALSWNSVAGATSYHVWRSTTSGSGYVNLATSATTGYTDTGLANGTTYYYVITAFNSLGESTNSTEVSATPFLPVPSAPTGLSATAGSAQVFLSWTNVSGATSYYIKRSLTSGSGYVNTATNATANYTDTGLANGTTYYYVVSAVNAAGEGANSSETNATPQIVAPTGLSATAGNAQVALSWTASAGAMSYAIKRSTISGGPYTSIATNATTTYTNTGLANNTTYYFVVSALAGNSQSVNSSQVAATPVNGAAIVVVNGPSTVVTGSSASTVTTPVTVALGANTLVVLINNMKETATGAWTVTWNGQTLTNAVVLQSSSTGAKSCIYYLYNPATDGAAHNLSVTFTSGSTGYHIQYFTLSGVNTAIAPLTGSANAAGATETFTISGCPLNGLAALNAVNSSSGSTTTSITNYGSGILTAQNLTGSSPSCSIGYANYIAAGSDTFTATASTSGKFAFTAAVFTPASVGGGNTAPVLPPIANTNINAGVSLNVTNNGSDSDTPSQTLTYTLPTAPTNASIGALSGILSWRPLVTQANTTNPFSVVVTDNGTPNMSATQNFSVVVNPLVAPSAASGSINNGLFNLIISGQYGPDYAVQASSNLMDWNTIFITNSPALPFNWSDTNSSSEPLQFYRIKIGPPLP